MTFSQGSTAAVQLDVVGFVQCIVDSAMLRHGEGLHAVVAHKGASHGRV